MFIPFTQSYQDSGRNEECIWCKWLSSLVCKLFCRWHRRTSTESMDILCKADFDDWRLSFAWIIVFTLLSFRRIVRQISLVASSIRMIWKRYLFATIVDISTGIIFNMTMNNLFVSRSWEIPCTISHLNTSSLTWSWKSACLTSRYIHLIQLSDPYPVISMP